MEFLRSVAFQICSLFYICMLIFLYFSKKRIKTDETKIFSCLLICNLIGLFLDVSSVYTIAHIDKVPILNFVISKGYLIYLLTWITMFTYYIFILSKMGKEFTNRVVYINTIRKILYVCYFIFLILT